MSQSGHKTNRYYMVNKRSGKRTGYIGDQNYGDLSTCQKKDLIRSGALTRVPKAKNNKKRRGPPMMF